MNLKGRPRGTFAVSEALRSFARARDNVQALPRGAMANRQRFSALISLHSGRTTANQNGDGVARRRVPTASSSSSLVCQRALAATPVRFHARQREEESALGHSSYSVFGSEDLGSRRRGELSRCACSRLPRSPDLVREALGEAVDARRLVVRLSPVITVTYPH